MFIRKRVRKLKNESNSVTYQAVENYREKGKVRQRVISLGKNPKIIEVLNEEIRFAERMRKDLDYPISKYTEVRWKRNWGLVVVAVPEKIALRRRNELAIKYQKQIQRIAILESLASGFK
jgi:hypothetical protein